MGFKQGTLSGLNIIEGFITLCFIHDDDDILQHMFSRANNTNK